MKVKQVKIIRRRNSRHIVQSICKSEARPYHDSHVRAKIWKRWGAASRTVNSPGCTSTPHWEAGRLQTLLLEVLPGCCHTAPHRLTGQPSEKLEGNWTKKINCIMYMFFSAHMTILRIKQLLCMCNMISLIDLQTWLITIIIRLVVVSFSITLGQLRHHPVMTISKYVHFSFLSCG